MNIKVFYAGDEVIVVIYQDYKKSLNFIRDKLFYRNKLRNRTLKQLEAIKEIIDGNKEN